MILRYDLPKEYKISTNAIYSWKTHWAKRKKIADYFHYISLQDCKQLKQITKPVNLRFEFYFKTRALDSSNCSFIAKCIEDWLVKNWLLKDDNNKYILSVTYQSITKKDIEKDFIRIIID